MQGHNADNTPGGVTHSLIMLSISVGDFCIIFSGTVLLRFEFKVELPNLHHWKCKLWQKLSCLSNTTLGNIIPNSLSIMNNLITPFIYSSKKIDCIPEKKQSLYSALLSGWLQGKTTDLKFSLPWCFLLLLTSSSVADFRDQGLLAEKEQIQRPLQGTSAFQDYVFPL